MSFPIICRCLALASVFFIRDLALVNALTVPMPHQHQQIFYRYRLAAADQPVPKEIIGKDDRQAVANGGAYPWSAIGRVFPGNCTATLVGADVLLTNAHCALDYEHGGRQYQAITFQPNIIHGSGADPNEAAKVTEVIAGTNFVESNNYRMQYPGWRGISLGDSAQDWALLKLNRPLGLKYGYWKWRTMPTNELVKDHRHKLAIAGYPYDFHQPNHSQDRGNTLAVQEGCSILKEERNMYFHDCDTAKGSSGSPIFYKSGRNHYMVALNNATGGHNNFAVNLRDLPTFLPSDNQREDINETAAGDELRTTVRRR
jgi:V8-like Glu-specific endopeptidase